MKRDLRYGGTTAGKEELAAIIGSALRSVKTGNWQAGEEARKMEQEAAKFLDVKHGILTTSGSCAGLLAFSALELPKGSEVIISAVTFPTIFNIPLQLGLVPVVVDAKIGTYGFDVNDVMRAVTEKTRAVIAIHPVGNPVDMPDLMRRIKFINRKRKENKIYVIEDNCDGWGGNIGNKQLGSFGDISITSFHAAHIVSMGVGGGVFTSNNTLATKVRMYRDWGRLADLGSTEKFGLPKDYPSRFIYEKIGYNFQILELQAAMGRVQLKKTNIIKKARQRNFKYLVKHLSRHKQIILPRTVQGANVCWFSLPLTVTDDRGPLLEYLEKAGIETRTMFAGNITKHPAYKKSKYRTSGRLDGANVILNQSFWLTVHPRLKMKDLYYIVDVFDKYYAKAS